MMKYCIYLFLAGLLFCPLSLLSQGPGNVVSIEDFIAPDAKRDSGFVHVYVQNEKYYLDIPNLMLERDILASITVIRGATQKVRTLERRFGYGGDSVFDLMIRFRLRREKIEIVTTESFESGIDSSAIYKRYLDSTLDPVRYSFDIVAQSPESFLIDITGLINSDCELFSLKGAKDLMGLDAYQPQMSYPTEVKAYPENIVFRSRRSYILNPLSPEEGETRGPSDWDVGASWFLLPKDPMPRRLADKRVGYFSFSLRGHVAQSSRMDIGAMAARWRLEPNDKDKERYLKGELVEPKKPIVFYIDSATPTELVPYFIEAVNAWQPAFEEAGFKNAIYALPAPTKEQDPDYSEDDIRYSFISYKASPIPNAYGPIIVDPRSGEILCSHIGVFHSVMDLLQKWYFVMCGTTDPGARKYPIDIDLMGQLIGTVVTHEVGHTLGLRHNFIGSTLYPTDSLRNRDFIRKNGLGSSIMDYQRFNYVAQPGDGLAREDLFPRIGHYDRFAIEWGYRYFGDFETPYQEAAKLNSWTLEKKKDKRNAYLIENTLGDPRVQSEDSGDDIVLANTYGMNNLKLIMANNLYLKENQDDDHFSLLDARYHAVLNQYRLYINHVLNLVGGKFVAEPEPVDLVNLPGRNGPDKGRQLAALDFLGKYLLTEQLWLYPLSITKKAGLSDDGPERYLGDMFALLLVRNLPVEKTDAEKRNILSYGELLNYLYAEVFEKMPTDRPLTLYEKRMQRTFVTQLTVHAENRVNLTTGRAPLLSEILFRIKMEIEKKMSQNTDYLTLAHYRALNNFITIWETGDQKSLISKQ